MAVTGIEVWVLLFMLNAHDSFVGGEYQTRERCAESAGMQMPHWTLQHGRQLRWRCELRRM
jgi:hypothetical protein